jgi:Glycosyl transferase family 2
VTEAGRIRGVGGVGGTPDTVTACLIVQDERERLPKALASVAFCDQVIVVDGGSTDDTVEIARRAGATVIENPWPGFALQRNIALDAAGSDWVLEIDADERISPRLRDSILALLAQPPPGQDMAVFALRNRFLGGPLGPSAKYPSYRSRLFRRDAYRHDEGRAVHEGIELRGRPLILAGDLEHELAGNTREALGDLWRYARLDSRHVARPSGPLGYLKGIVVRPAAKLVYRTAIDGGWRDGWRGMAKISLDVVSDALVWTLVLLGAGRRDGAPGVAPEHFGRRRVGPVKIVAVAAGASATAQATRWLERLHDRGADVALVCDAPDPAVTMPLQRVRRLRPLSTIHALETEMHVRPIDAVVPVGRRAQLVLRAVPASLRPAIAGLSVEREPSAADLGSGPDSP